MPKPAKSPNPVARLDAIITDWERLQDEANAIIDAFVEEMRETTPGVPASSLRVYAITNRAGSTMNVAVALRLIKQAMVNSKERRS